MKKEKFYKLKSSIFENKNLSCSAKLIYALIVDRFSLSMLNIKSWHDCDGFIFCYIKTDDIKKWLNVSRPTISKAYKELIDNKLISITRQGKTKPNQIYLLDDNANKVMSKIFTSRCQKSLHHDVKNLYTNKTYVSKTEISKEKKESKKKSAFYHTPKDEIIDFLLNTIIKIDLKHLKNDPLHHANKIYDYYELNEWTLNNGKVIKDYNALELLLKSWNNREKDYLKNNVKEPEKKQRKIEWLDDYIEKLADLEKD